MRSPQGGLEASACGRGHACRRAGRRVGGLFELRHGRLTPMCHLRRAAAVRPNATWLRTLRSCPRNRSSSAWPRASRSTSSTRSSARSSNGTYGDRCHPARDHWARQRATTPVPVGNGLRGATFWIITEPGRRSDYVKNIEKDPHVRVKVGRRWYAGTAHILPDDDPAQRMRRLRRRANDTVVRVVAPITWSSASTSSPDRRTPASIPPPSGPRSRDRPTAGERYPRSAARAHTGPANAPA